MEELTAYHVTVSGLVQGVGFRYTTLRQAERIGVAGWVRNTHDGKVEVVCEGSEEKIKQFIAFLSKGPPGAYVRSIDKRKIAPRGFIRFTVEF